MGLPIGNKWRDGGPTREKKNKGGRVLVDRQGHFYLILKASKQQTYWKCQYRKKSGCKASASLQEDSVEILSTMEHNHSRDLVKELVNKVET